MLQGEYITNCPVPVIPSTFSPSPDRVSDILIEDRNVIVITQSCDLAQDKAPFAALCPVYTLDELTEVTEKFSNNSSREQIRQGRYEGLHMLAGFEGPEMNDKAIVVDFRQIYSLPTVFLKQFVKENKNRKHLNSPYLEHLAQSFARFFMRVGLPSNISKFK